MLTTESLLRAIAEKDWGGRSLMQEGRLSGGVFAYDPVHLDYPWAKQLSFIIENVTYKLKIPRKTLVEGSWQPVALATLEPIHQATHTTKVIEVLIQILDGKQALP